MSKNRFALVCGAASLVAACAGPLPTTDPADLTEPLSGFIQGYLPAQSLVDSVALLPPPPAAGSAAQAADDKAYRAARRWQSTVRWQWAERDAELGLPKAAEAFSCALGMPNRAETAPHLNMLLRRTLSDTVRATITAKDYYRRERPFMATNDPICTPNLETALRKNGSYPSGHAAIGWAWALVLTELAPERADALLQRGYAFGQSRLVCGVHWHSDVEAGRTVGSAVVAQLHANAEFTAQLGAARTEIATARAGDARPGIDCAAETKALATQPPIGR